MRRLDDPEAAIFGTVGYQAPEVPKTGPTVASDLYTLGRSLLVLILDWPNWQGADRESLPPREAHDVLIEHDGLWRFVQRACAADPAQRFADADEMTDALHGVLCQVAAATDGLPRPRTSTRYSPPRPQLDGTAWRALPAPLLPNHPRLPNRVAGVADSDPEAAVRLVAEDDELSWADLAALGRAHCERGDTASADTMIGRLDPASADAAAIGAGPVLDNARSYLHGVSALAAGDGPRAATLLADAYAGAPGEPATALAYAAALVTTGDPDRLPEAADLYEQVALTDPSWGAAVAGLADTLRALGRPEDAPRVLTAVPPGHPLRTEALTRACRAMEEGRWDPAVAAAAGDAVRATPPDRRGAADAELAAALYTAALAALARGETVGEVAGHRATPKYMAKLAEESLLDLADATPDPERRHRLLDAAARTRPWSMW